MLGCWEATVSTCSASQVFGRDGNCRPGLSVLHAGLCTNVDVSFFQGEREGGRGGKRGGEGGRESGLLRMSMIVITLRYERKISFFFL